MYRENNFTTSQPKDKTLLPISETLKRREEIRRVFENLRLETDEKDKEGEPVIIDFSDEEIDKIITDERIFQYTPEALKKAFQERYLEHAKCFYVDPGAFKRMIIISPRLIVLNTETINSHIADSSKLLEITPRQFIQASIIEPKLATRSPQTINEHCTQSAILLNIAKEDFIKHALKTPRLLLMKPETLMENAYNSAENLQISRELFLKAVLRHPILLCRNPETINKNIEDSSARLEITKEEFVEAALKFPSLFSSSPETIESNIISLAILLHIDKEQAAHLALESPTLFYQSPDTIAKNAELSAEKIGVSKDEFIKASLKHPDILTLSPLNIEGKFNVFEMIFSAQIAREKILKDPLILNYSKLRNLLHYFAQEIVGKRKKISANPENIIRQYFATEPEKAEKVIFAIKEIYGRYTEREKKESKKERERKIDNKRRK